MGRSNVWVGWLGLGLAWALGACGAQAAHGGGADASIPEAAGPDVTQSAPEVPRVAIDRDHLRDLAGSGALDYADPALWACRPGNDPNACHANLDATDVGKDGSLQVVPHVRAPHPAFDCFYLSPTGLADLSDAAPMQEPLLAQAARFTRVCEVYAPLYRGSDEDDPALTDVLAAFQHYVEVLGSGRKFVVLGHGRGAALGVSLLTRSVDRDPALRERLISAVLLGAAPTVPLHKPVGGSFEHIALCSAPGEVGCLIAYNSFDVKAPPDPVSARFGATADPGREVACNEPGPLGRNRGNYRGSYFAVHAQDPSLELPGFRSDEVSTPFLLYRDYFSARCVHNPGSTYLELSIAPQSDDQRVEPPYRSQALEASGWGLHQVDFQPALDDLIEAVSLQAAVALAD